MSTDQISPWWRPENHQDRRPFLLSRNRIRAAVRQWFEARDFIEVEAAALQVSPGNEAHLHAFATEMISTSGTRATAYLHTSPEFACKKLLAKAVSDGLKDAKKPLLTIDGTEDSVIPMEDTMFPATAGAPRTFFLVPGDDHCAMANLELVIGVAKSWLDRELAAP